MELKLVNSVLFCVFLADMIMSIPEDEGIKSQDENNFEDDSGDIGEPLNEKDLQAAKNLVEESNTDTAQLEQSGLFEGDIAVDNKKTGRNAQRNREWPNGIIPYTISSEYSSSERAAIAKAIKEIEEKTCLRIPARSSEPDYVHINRGKGCSSYVGKIGGKQNLNLAQGCVTTGIIHHEFMHAAGFHHEQVRTDRDKFVKIKWENLMDRNRWVMRKKSQERIDHLGAPYDYCSIMHYTSHAYSKNLKATIVPLKKGKCELVGKHKFSDMDIRKLNTLYKCTGYPQVSCTDEHKACSWFADKGLCTQRYARFMNDKCKKACDLCDKGCYDNSWNCPKYVRWGLCDTKNKWNMNYMARHCRMSCKFC